MDVETSAWRWRLPEFVPQVRGLGWWPFLAVWLTAFAFAIVGVVLYVRDDFELTPPAEYSLGFKPRLPINTGVPDDGAVVDLVLSREARASGLKPGDRVIALDGHTLGHEMMPVRALWQRLGEPARVDLLAASSDGVRRTHRLTSQASHADEGIAASGVTYRTWRLTRGLVIVWIGLSSLALAVLLLTRRSHDRLAPWVSLTLVMNAIDTSGAARSSALLESLPSVVWSSISVVAASLLCTSIAVFPEGRLRPLWCWPILAVALMLQVVAGFGHLSGLWANLVTAIAEALAIAVIWARYRAMPPGTARQQIRWALLGIGLSVGFYFAGVVAEGIGQTTDPATLIRSNVASYLLYGVYGPALFAALTIGLMRYRLYDAEATISRSVAYGTITVALLAIFTGSEKLLEVLGEEHFGRKLGGLAAAASAAVAAVCVSPLHHRVTRWAEKRFRSGLVHLRHGLPLLVGDMRETATPAELADTMLTRVRTGVRARHGAVVIGGVVLDTCDIDVRDVSDWLNAHSMTASGEALDCDRSDPLFPVRVLLQADGVGDIGWLLLGPRPDGSFYGREEREALREIADPVARALAIAIERERRETARQERDASFEHQLASLRRTIGDVQRQLTHRGNMPTAHG